MFQNYFKSAFRNLSRNKVYAGINIVGLSMGLACVMLIILFTRDELSFDKFHANGNQLYRVNIENRKPDGSVEMRLGSTGHMQGPKFSSAIPEIASFLRLRDDYKDMKRGTEVKSQQVHLADSNFFTFFSFPLLKGNPRTALQAPNSIVISEEIAIRFFGTTDVLGKTIDFRKGDSFEPYQVTAVAKKTPQNSSIRFEMMMPMVVDPAEMSDNLNWFNSFQTTFVRLANGTNLQTVETKMHDFFLKDAATAIVMAKEKFNFNNTYVHKLQQFTDIHLSKEYGPSSGMSGGSQPFYSYILSGIALFILLIACINFVNLTVARSVKRAKEIGVRKVIGGNRKQLIMQFLGESFLLCSISFLLGIALAQLFLPTFNTLANKSLSLSYLFDAKLIIGYIALFLITGLLAGFYPAFVLSRFNPVQTLYKRFSPAGKNYLQKGLVVFQFALATLMIVATTVVYLQFQFLTNKELGYDDKNVIVVNRWGIKPSEVKVFRQEMMKSPDIISVAAKNGGWSSTRARINGKEEMDFAYERIDEEYLPLLKIPVVAGRNFSVDHPYDSSQSVLVNEAFVKKAGWKDPLGQEVDFWYRNIKFKVVGVVKDYHSGSLSQEIMPQLFAVGKDNDLGRLFIRVKPGTEVASLQKVGDLYKKMFPLTPYEYKFVSDENRAQYQQEAKWKQMMFFGAIITIFISCIGLFGLSVLAAEKRVKEIGIRKVLGASVTGLASALSKDFLKLVVLAMLIAMPVAWILANRWLASYPYRFDLNGWTFVFAGIVVVLLALFTISFQAIKSAQSNPVKSLRSE
jgi:putative ABC transport system permease protein